MDELRCAVNHVLACLSAFSSPEPTILQARGWDRELWFGPTPEVRESLTSRQIPFSSPEPTILLPCGRNRELWEQPFQACAIDADCVRPDGQNSVISFVISKWLLPELSFSETNTLRILRKSGLVRALDPTGQKDRRLWGRELS